MDSESLPYLNFGLAILGISTSLGTTLFFIGKWAAGREYINSRLTVLDSEIKGLQIAIDGLRKENKDDRHMFRGDIQKWQEGLLRDINARFDGAKIDGEAATERLWKELNRRFDALDCGGIPRGKK